MDYDLLIFQLKHLRGIGNKGLLRILQYYQEHPLDEKTLDIYMKLGQVRSPYSQLFMESFHKAMTITNEEMTYFLEYYSFITILDDAYPEELIEIYNPPIALFYLGDVSLLKKENSLAVIGSREATSFGKQIVDRLIPPLCEKDIIITSGLAKGNDTYAHQATIRNHGQTIAVIGSGLNVCYPRTNENLQKFIANEHLLISEYLPGTKPLKHHFPSRNRIIAGITRGTCVIESKAKSGTFITAQLALNEGRDVFSVPGNPLLETSEGCLQLIQSGAKCIWKAADILEEWYLD